MFLPHHTVLLTLLALVQHRKHNRAVRRCSPSGSAVLPSVIRACTAIFSVPLFYIPFSFWAPIWNPLAGKWQIFSFATLVFCPVGEARCQCIRTLRPVLASGSVSMCPPQFCSCSAPKLAQTPSVSCMRSKRATQKTVCKAGKQLNSTCVSHSL